MADWWRVDGMDLNDRDRKLTVHRLRSIRAACSRDSSTVAAVIDQFITQVEAAADPVWLDLSGLEMHLPGEERLYGPLHWTVVLESLAPPLGRLRCLECGEGTVMVPRRLTTLLSEFASRYQLGDYVANPNERQRFIDLPADRGARVRVVAERKVEQARLDERRRREEERSRRVLTPGTLADDAPVYEPPVAASPDFMPAGYRR